MELSKEGARIIYEGLKEAGINFVVNLPDSWLKEFNKLLSTDPDLTFITVTREEEGIGVAAGASLGGKKVAMTMENTGIGNSATALTSLNVRRKIPLLMLISYRGGIGEMFSYASHGITTEPLLQALRIPYWLLTDKKEAEEMIKECQSLAESQKTPVAILLTRKVLWEGI